MLAITAEAEAPSRKVLYLPLLDHYPGLGLLYCIWSAVFLQHFYVFRQKKKLCLGEG